MKDGSRETIQNLAIVVSLVVVTFLNHLDVETFFRGFSDSDPVPRLADLRWQKRLGDFGVDFGAGSLVAGFVADRVRAKGLWAVLVGVWILLELSTGHLGDVFFGAAALDGVVTFVSCIGSVAGGALSIAICIFSSKELSVSDLASRSMARWSDGSPAEKHLEVDHHRRDASIFVFFSSETLICNTIGCFSLLFVACLQFWSTDYVFDRFHLELPPVWSVVQWTAFTASVLFGYALTKWIVKKSAIHAVAHSRFVAATLLAMCIILLSIPYTTSVNLVIALVLLTATLTAIPIVSFIKIILDTSPNTSTGTNVGISLFFASAAFILADDVTSSLIAYHGYSSVYLFGAVVVACGAFAMMFVRPGFLIRPRRWP